MERALREEPMPDLSCCAAFSAPKPSGFLVTIKCLDDGQRVQFIAARGLFGLTVSPTLAGRKVSTVLANYKAA